MGMFDTAKGRRDFAPSRLSAVLERGLTENKMDFDVWMTAESNGKYCDGDDNMETRLLRRCWNAATTAERDRCKRACRDIFDEHWHRGNAPNRGELAAVAANCESWIDALAKRSNVPVEGRALARPSRTQS